MASAATTRLDSALPAGPLALILILVFAAMFVADKALARLEAEESRLAAERSLEKGVRLLGAGRAAEAIDPLRNAHWLERDDQKIGLRFIDALMATGKLGDAGVLLDEVLGREPNGGEANLAEARLLKLAGRAGDAEAYYHRAIYGFWPGDAAASRIAARRELIASLNGSRDRQKLLVELISLEAEQPKDRGIRKEMARLFLAVGSPGRAAAIDQSLIQQDPGDTPVYEDLGNAELEQGNYAAARTAFLRRFMREPNQPSSRTKLRLLNTVMALDPTPRRLTSREKYRRSARILELARQELDACTASRPPAAGAPEAPFPPHVTNEESEKVLAQALEIWRTRVARCGPLREEEEPIRLVMARLSE